METKPPKQRYTPDDLKSRDPAADEAALDAWLLRNKDLLNSDVRKAWEEFARGEYLTLDEAMAELRARRATPSAKA